MMDIAEVIKNRICQHQAELLRRKRFDSSIGRKGLRRQYHEDVIDHLALITLARRVGFSLTEIAEILMIRIRERAHSP